MIYKAGDMTSKEFPCEILRRLPGSAMAEVYLAKLQNTNHLVVVKGVAQNAPKSVKEVLKREARILQTIRLETIPEIYGYFEDGQKQYYIMSYHLGSNLGEMLMKEGLTEKQIKKIALSVCRTLIYLHKKGIVYGDLKPANIILSEEGVTLLDYGMAVCLDETQSDIYFQGTFGYAAPECFRGGTGCATYLADVFALGATLYRLLEGQEPKKHYGRLILTDIQKKNRWQSVLNKCCALEPENRFQSVAQIYDAISKIDV